MKIEGACPYCHTQIPPSSAFCVNCGRDLRFYEEPSVTKEKTQPKSKQNCTYCQKDSPEGSSFCVHCGKQLQSDGEKRKETLVGSSSNNISSIFNALILLAAIASIFGFIYFYVENKITTPADKNPVHEEVVGNLYRNTKYQFRIKFPESWEIKKGDGPNILVKASNGEGSSINIYVKDLGIELGDIDDLISLDDWANSINEKFPSAKILSKKEIYIDNKKAYFVQYAITYKALDQETNGIFYNVSLVNKKYNYAITAGSGESKFESEKHLLDASVRTFVIEEYGTDVSSQDRENIFQSEKNPIKKEKEVTESNSLNRPWFRNAFHGVSFKTPRALEKQSSKAPPGYEDYVEKLNTYSSSESGISILFFYAETKFTTYDKKEGLRSSISNMVNGMGGADLDLQFFDVKNNFDDLKCSGSFKFKGSEIKIRGYIYWNGQGEFFLLTTMGQEKNVQSMDKVIESIRINHSENTSQSNSEVDFDSSLLSDLKYGQWEGTAYQSNISETWSIQLSYNDATKEFLVKYPTLNCEGHWSAIRATDSQIEFTEFIDTGKNSCNNGGMIILKKLNENSMEYLYYWPDKTTLDAKGQIKRKE